MNYIAEIIRFYEVVQMNNLSTGQIALWHGLMHICNKSGWKATFNAPNITLELVTGLSRSAIQKNRVVLKELGLIDFKPNGTKATVYTIKSMQENVQEGNQESNQESVQEDVDTSKSVQVGVQESNQESVQEESDMLKSVQVSVQESVQIGGAYLNKNKYTLSNMRKDKNDKFIPPSIEDVITYCRDKGYKMNPKTFFSHYESIKWMSGCIQITDWKAAADKWESREKPEPQWDKPRPVQRTKNRFHNFEQRQTDYDKMLREQQYPGYYQDTV